MVASAAALDRLIRGQAAKVHGFKARAVPASATIKQVDRVNSWIVRGVMFPDSTTARILPLKPELLRPFMAGESVKVLHQSGQNDQVMVVPRQ